MKPAPLHNILWYNNILRDNDKVEFVTGLEKSPLDRFSGADQREILFQEIFWSCLEYLR